MSDSDDFDDDDSVTSSRRSDDHLIEEEVRMSPGKSENSKFRSGLNETRALNQLCDVVIVVEGNVEFPAHRNILAASSSYFMAMFTGSFKESQSRRIPIDPKGELGIKADAIRQLFDYIYTGRITISAKNAIDLIMASELLDLPEVKAKAVELLENHITLDNYLTIRNSNLFNANKLKAVVFNFTKKNFAEFAKTQDFLDLEEEELKSLLELKPGQFRGCSNEAIVLEAVLVWCKHKRDFSKFVSLARHINFMLISSKYLEDCLVENAIVRKSKDLSDYLRSQLVPDEPEKQLVRQHFQEGFLVAMPWKSDHFYLVSFVGGQLKHAVKKFPQMILDRDVSRNNYSVCKVGRGHMLLLEGDDSFDLLHIPKKCFLYDVVADTWNQMPSIKVNFRTTLAAVGSDAYYSYNATSSNDADYWRARVLKMDLSGAGLEQHREWKPMAKLDRSRLDVHLVSAAGRLYAVGGTLDIYCDSTPATSMVEVYDSSQKVWREVASMSEDRSKPGIAVSGGIIYVVGGYSCDKESEEDDGPTNSAEYYDPSQDLWTSLPDMKYPRASPAVAHCNGKLYVFGGLHKQARPNKLEVECYDFATGKWSMLRTSIAASNAACYMGDFFMTA